MSGRAAGPALRAPRPEPDNESWVAVPDAAGLLRTEVLKPDGRRITIYRRSEDGQLDHRSQ